MLNRIINNEGSGTGEWTLLSRIIWLKATVLAAAGAAWHTVTGAIVSFIAAKAHPLKELVVNIEPLQSGSGDPSPDNVRPITGWTGANAWRTGTNVWDEQTELGLLNSDGSVSSYQTRLVSSFVPVVSGETYAFRWPSNSGRGRGAFYDANKNLVQYENDFPPSSGITNVSIFTVPENACYLRFNLTSTYGATYNNDISINYPDTDHDYHDYNGDTFAVTWQDEMYGGSAKVVEGKRTDEWVKIVFDGSEDELWTVPSEANPAYFAIWNNPASIGNDDRTQIANWLIGGGSNYQPFGHFRAQANGAIAVGNLDGGVAGAYHFETKADFKTYLANNPLEVCYKVANPTETAITPTPITALQGQNNVWADSGDVTVTFRGTPIVEPDAEPLQALNLLLGGAYRNEQTPEDVPDNEALDILLGGADR